MAVFGVSTTYIEGDNRYKHHDRMAPCMEAIITFFNHMRLENDAMPDKLEYQLYATKKKEVFGWYDNIVKNTRSVASRIFTNNGNNMPVIANSEGSYVSPNVGSAMS